MSGCDDVPGIGDRPSARGAGNLAQPGGLVALLAPGGEQVGLVRKLAVIDGVLSVDDFQVHVIIRIVARHRRQSHGLVSTECADQNEQRDEQMGRKHFGKP